MIITNVKISNGAQVFLIEEFLPVNVHQMVKNLFNEFGTDKTNWRVPEWTQGRPRYVYCGNSENFTALKNYINSDEFLNRIGQLLNVQIANTGIDLWIDFSGFGTLAPHYENEGSIYLSQIYISDKQYPFIGTTIYNDQKEILFQLPFRDNFGWLFNKGYTVMHGREHDIPEDLARCSVMLWFDKK